MASPPPPPPPSPTPTYHTILTHLLTTYAPPLLPPSPKPHSTDLRTSIAALSLHPTLEAALHILNADLPSAHFLLRHMQSAPAHEAMYLHGILHRIEGDYDNARAWYANVADSDVYRQTWEGDLEGGSRLIDDVEVLRKGRPAEKHAVDTEALGHRSIAEITHVLSFCETKLGTGKLLDAREAWTGTGEQHKKMASDMIVGGEGWREF